jgi:hypothetical protein
VYNCGTNFNRQQTDEANANQVARTEETENRDWMINDVVGTKTSWKQLAKMPIRTWLRGSTAVGGAN